MIKKTLVFLLFINLVWADNSCKFETKTFENKILKKYQLELKNYSAYTDEKFCEVIEHTRKAVMFVLYKENKQSDTNEVAYKTIVAVINRESKSIEESEIYKKLRDEDIAELSISIETKRFKNISSTYGFAINMNYLEKHGALYINHTEFSIYEKYLDTLKTMHQKHSTSSMYFHSLEKNGHISEYLNSEKVLTPYATLEFKRLYTFHLFPESGGEHQYWEVTLDEPQLYHYKNGKYEAVKQKFKPIFDLDQVLKNTKKGLKYKELVLRAMLYEKPITKNNVEKYRQISTNLKDSKHKEEATFLEGEVRESGFRKIEDNIWSGIYIYKGLDVATGSATESKWTFYLYDDKSCEVVINIEEYSIPQNEKEKPKTVHKKRIHEQCTLSEVRENYLPESKKLKEATSNMQSILLTTEDNTKYIFLKNKNDYLVSGYNITLPRNWDFLYNLNKIISSIINIDFENYMVKKVYKNSNKPLIQKGFGRLYRTLLKKALKEKKPEFAGKYIIAQWGCDEGEKACITGGVIDASTGKTTEFPFKYYAHNGSKEIIYKLNSSLIIFAGDFEFKDGKKEENKVLFYEFNNGEFLFLKSTAYKGRR